MDRKIKNRIFSFLLLAILLAPLSIQFIHSFEEHKIERTLAQGINNFQNKDTDCSAYHTQINHNSIDFLFDFSFQVLHFLNSENFLNPIEGFQTFINLSSSRAPPTFIF